MAFCLFHMVVKFSHPSAFQRRGELPVVWFFDFVMALAVRFVTNMYIETLSWVHCLTKDGQKYKKDLKLHVQTTLRVPLLSCIVHHHKGSWHRTTASDTCLSYGQCHACLGHSFLLKTA